MKIGRKIAEGRTAEVFEYGEGKVVKLFRENYSGNDVVNDIRMSTFVASIFNGAPLIYGTIEHSGRIGCIMERVDGKTLTSILMKNPRKTGRLARAMADIHYAIHEIDARDIRTQKEYYERMIRYAHELSDDEKERIIEYMKSLPDGKKLCHGDFHPENILFSSRGPVVIDWMTAAKGLPACDVARTYLIMKFAALPPHIPLPFRMIISIMRSFTLRAYLSGYRARSGITWNEIDMWMLPVAAVRLIEGNPPSEQRNLLKLVRKEYSKRIR
jgi:aminoglycoside phosphotransferase (APT) family kinase protein